MPMRIQVGTQVSSPGIGAEVIDGTAGSVLFIDASVKLGEYNPGFTFTEAGGLVVEPTGDAAITANKNIVLKSGQKLIFDGA